VLASGVSSERSGVVSKEERRRERQEREKWAHDQEVRETVADIRFFRARGTEVEVHPGNDDVREHLMLLPGALGGGVDASEATQRAKRLDQLEKTAGGRAVIREALNKVGHDDPLGG
jgi:hypothetical protein